MTASRRWFQVSLREVFLIALAIAFALAWLSDRWTAAPIHQGVEYLPSVQATSVYGQCVAIEGDYDEMTVEVMVSRQPPRQRRAAHVRSA